MTYVDVTLGARVTVRMKLNEAGAPKTSGAFAAALPFEGRAVHAQTSGQMFRMLDDVPIDVEEVETPIQYQSRGMAVYLPHIHEIAFAYGNARFSGAAGPSTLTYLGDLDGDLTSLIDIVGQIRQSGAISIKFARSQDQTSPLTPTSHGGSKVKIDLDGVSAEGTLLEQESPITTKALAAKLPTTLKSVNDTWRGQHTRLGEDNVLAGLGVSEPEESSTHLTTAGTIYYSPEFDELSFAYGLASNTLRDGVPEVLTPVIALDGDWTPVQDKARAQLVEGAKTMTISLA
jgi:uncharacterized protein DUF3830